MDTKPTAEQIVEMMLKLFGDSTVDTEVFPAQFKFQVALAKFELSLQK